MLRRKPQWPALWFSAFSVLALGGCRKAPTLDTIAREYLRDAVALGERDPDALDYYYGPADLVADIRSKPLTLQQIDQSASDALARLASMEGDPTRRAFLAVQLRALIVRTQLLRGKHRTFDQESEAFFGFVPSIDTASTAPIRAEIARRLPGTKSLVDRFSAFDAKFMIPPERVQAVMSRALEACREQTRAHLKLPAAEHVTLEFVGNKPWAAYSYYHGNFQSVIQINADFGLTVDRALELACHEGYPGHHVFNSLTDEYLVRGQKRMELLAQPTFSPQSFLSEAAATVAPDIAFPTEERIRLERDVLFPLAGLENSDVGEYVEIERLVESLAPDELSVARDYVDDNLEFVRAAEALEQRALMAHPEATIRYLNEFRSYVVTYTAGHERMRQWFSGKNSWETLRQLILKPQAFTDR